MMNFNHTLFGSFLGSEMRVNMPGARPAPISWGFMSFFNEVVVMADLSNLINVFRPRAWRLWALYCAARGR
jgi:hypothetical protein